MPNSDWYSKWRKHSRFKDKSDDDIIKLSNKPTKKVDPIILIGDECKWTAKKSYRGEYLLLYEGKVQKAFSSLEDLDEHAKSRKIHYKIIEDRE